MVNIEELFRPVARVIEKTSNLIPNSITDKDIAPLANKWLANKQHFIDKLGDNLIWESEDILTFHLSEEQKKFRRDQFIENIESGIIRDFFECNLYGFFDNKTTGDYRFSYQDEEENSELSSKSIFIPGGMKIGKALNQFFRDDPYTDIDYLILEYSRLIQEDKITGRLCISVHPLDFLSISENTLNWRSCHALDGEYRSGNLSYICDNVTFVTYLRSEEQVFLPRFPDDLKWNNKKWRALMFLDTDRKILWCGRHYPFFNYEIMNTVRNVLFKQNFINDSTFSDWRHSIIDSVQMIDSPYTVTPREDYIFYDGNISRLRRWVSDGEKALNYNDLTRSTCYKPWFLMYEETPYTYLNTVPSMKVGAAVPCPACGKVYLETTDVMVCPECKVKKDRYWMDRLKYAAEYATVTAYYNDPLPYVT